MSTTTGKRVAEDWSVFNDAVQRRAAGLPPRGPSPAGARPGGTSSGTSSGAASGTAGGIGGGAGGGMGRGWFGRPPPYGAIPLRPLAPDAPFVPPGSPPGPPMGPPPMGPAPMGPAFGSPSGSPMGAPVGGLAGGPWLRTPWSGGILHRRHRLLRALFALLILFAILAAMARHEPETRRSDQAPPGQGAAADAPDGPAMPPVPDTGPRTAPPPRPWLPTTAPARPSPPEAGAAPTPPAPGGGPAVTNYTLFHAVDFHGGQVVTGWAYARSGDAAPTAQYCYYSRPGRPPTTDAPATDMPPGDVPTGDAPALPDGSRVTRLLLGPRGGSPAAAPNGSGGVTEIRYDIATRPGPGLRPLPDALAADLGETGWRDAAARCRWFGQ